VKSLLLSAILTVESQQYTQKGKAYMDITKRYETKLLNGLAMLRANNMQKVIIQDLTPLFPLFECAQHQFFT
jgi:hypothetical protein